MRYESANNAAERQLKQQQRERDDTLLEKVLASQAVEKESIMAVTNNQDTLTKLLIKQ